MESREKETVYEEAQETVASLDVSSRLKQKKNINEKTQKYIFIVALLAIPVVHWLIFWFYLNVQTIMLAFQNRSGQWSLEMFGEFWESLTSPYVNQDNSIKTALINTMKYFGVTVLVIIPLCLVISFFFYKRIAGYRIFRIIFYLPAIVSGIVFVTAYTEFLQPHGVLGAIQKAIGITPPERNVLARPETATNAILVYYVLTSFTTNVLLFSGAMARIPIEVLESAKLEGCGPWKELTMIIFPLIWPTFSTQLIFTLTGIFGFTGPILLFTNGKYKTSTVSFWIFKQVYGSGEQMEVGGTGEYNLVSCAGLCFTLVGVPLILGVRKLIEKIDTAEY